ncbi:MAG: hypothetical protein ACR2PL_24135 [Dehalococcoidia bacterium]
MQNTVVSLEFEAEEVQWLEAEACREEVSLPALVQRYVRAQLPISQTEEAETIAERNRRVGRAALAHLAELTKDLPSVDLTKALEESRRQLE